MNNKLFDRILKNLYDIESSIEVVKDEFEKENIDVDSFLKTIKVYINNYDLLTKSNYDIQLKLLDEKLDFIRRHYLHLSGYKSTIKANINFIEKHKETFFESTNNVKDLPYVVSDSLEPLDSVNIENFYSIENITLSNLKEKKEIYIVGENGDGKTLLLQAITVSLVGISQGKVFDLVKQERDYSFLSKDANIQLPVPVNRAGVNCDNQSIALSISGCILLTIGSKTLSRPPSFLLSSRKRAIVIVSLSRVNALSVNISAVETKIFGLITINHFSSNVTGVKDSPTPSAHAE